MLDDHPIIRKMERDGELEPDEPIEYDFYGNGIYEGDIVLQIDDKNFLERETSTDIKELLYFFGATKREASTHG